MDEETTNPWQAPQCNLCGKRKAYREFDHESLCTPCTITRLVEAVEKLSTAHVSVNAEIVYDE